MTWAEINKKYEQERRGSKQQGRDPKLSRNWGNLVKSTDKLVWLFMFSSARGGPRAG